LIFWWLLVVRVAAEVRVLTLLALAAEVRVDSVHQQAQQAAAEL
jgi:hypothetical protein